MPKTGKLLSSKLKEYVKEFGTDIFKSDFLLNNHMIFIQLQVFNLIFVLNSAFVCKNVFVNTLILHIFSPYFKQ